VAAVLVLNTPDDGRLRPKHVEWPCRNKTCSVASSWCFIWLRFPTLTLATYISPKGINQQNKVLPSIALYNETKIISDKFQFLQCINNVSTYLLGPNQFHTHIKIKQKKTFSNIIYWQRKRNGLKWHMYYLPCHNHSRSQWPRDLRSMSAAARLLRLWVRIPPTALMSVCLVSVVCCQVERSLRRADHSSRGVLQTVMRRYMWSRNLVNEEALALWGLLRHKQTNKPMTTATNIFYSNFLTYLNLKMTSQKSSNLS